MKSKPLKHKAANTFRFVPFAERINAIDIRHAALYHVEHCNAEQPGEGETHLAVALRKWHALNLTDGFRRFRRDVAGIVSLPQLLHRQQHVLDTLERHLTLGDPLCLQALLEILVSVAKDLRDDFYPHFGRFLDVLIKLLDTKDADQLEWTLVCLAFLFKVLRAYLKRDISVVLRRIIPLLSDSQPQYINNFAAESFAFVARDMRDKSKFLLLMLGFLKTQENAVRGCGHLVYEILRGVGGKFHSCADTFLPTLMDYFRLHPEYQDNLFQILTQTVSDMLPSIDPKECDVFWNSVIKGIETSLADKKDDRVLEYILRLAGQALEYNKGKFLAKPIPFVLLLIKILSYDLSENTATVCSQIGALLLLSPNLSLTQEHASIVVKMLLPIPYPRVLLDFVENVTDYSQFDMLVLPQFIDFIVRSDFNHEAMNTLTKVCLKKSPSAKNGIKLFEWIKYPIDFGKGLKRFNEKLDSIFDVDAVSDLIKKPESILCALIYLPHVKNVDVERNIQRLCKLISKLLTVLSEYAIESKTEKEQISVVSKSARNIMFILGYAIECAIHISNCKNVAIICKEDVVIPILLPYAAHPHYLCALHTLDLYLTALENDTGLTYPFLSLVDSYLNKNLHSPYHEIRLLTTHIYKIFEKVIEIENASQDEGSTEIFQVFSLCYSVEAVHPSVQEYRGQLNGLQRVAFDSTQFSLLKKTEFRAYALNYMFGVLYFNFKLLWEPVMEFISGYANGMPVEEFWPEFFKILNQSFDDIKRNEFLLDFPDEIETDQEFLRDLYITYNNINEKPDMGNYRTLLLQAMGSFISVCENKNRDVAALFLKFIEQEYHSNEVNRKANALRTDVQTHEPIHDLTASEQTENELEEEVDLSSLPTESNVSGKITFKTLLNIMQVLSKFKNPRALYRESEFWDLYMEFLCHKNAALQKFSLDCVLNYKNKNITPYKDNLYNLVDDKKFKDELTTFKITNDSDSIRSDDRASVMPIVLRILYGKMISKLGADKKSGGQIKRSLIMRNLAGCTEEELTQFIEMAFVYFKPYFTMKPKELHCHIGNNINLKALTSPSKLHSTLNLIEVVRECFGGYLGEKSLPIVFKAFYSVCSTIAAVLSRSEEVHIGYVKVFKNLRSLALAITRKLFNQFDKYEWSKEELFVLMDCLVWPILPKLPVEGIHSPTALLKLFACWCENPRYFILMCANKSEEPTISPLPYVFKLLLYAKTNPVVINVIMEMIENLLTLQEGDEPSEGPPLVPLKIDSALILSDDKILCSTMNLNFGSKILIPHIQSILEIMKRRVSNIAKSKTVNKRDLLILSRVTELVTTPKISQELLELLLPILVKKICSNMAEENMEHAVTTILNLLERSNNPQVYIKSLAVLFNKVSPVGVRKMLCKMLNSIAEKSPNNVEINLRAARVMHELNAYSPKWIEQPDFDRRLDAYKLIYQLSNEDSIDINLAILIVNNCFHSIKVEKDISLRDSAGLCLKKILPKLLLKYKSAKDGSVLVRDTVLAHISSGIRDGKNESVRNASIELLGVLVRECPTADVVLSDLAPLACDEDREVDFFDNMVHLQMHRRVRALLKFAKVAKKIIKCPTPRTLTNYILPLATTNLCDDRFTDKNTLIDACIDVVCSCARLLPWYHYEVVLKYYLNKMRHSTEYQKQLTRILVGILDAFHFDLSRAGDIVIPKALLANMEENTKLTITSKVDAEGADDDNKNDALAVNADEDEEEKLEEQLKVADQTEETAEVLVINDTLSVPAFERIANISPSVAKRIIKSLTTGLLPQLNRAISKMTEHEESHKVNRKHRSVERQEQDVLRVPLALAIVKLLQQLPGNILRLNLPGIIIKLCSFLKSPLKQVRLPARDIVKKIMLTVGTSYLGVLLEHLTILLTRGFQVHVLVATIHTVLDALKTQFTGDEIDTNLHYILNVCINDLFGALSEEKEVEKLGYKTPEAKPSKKTYVTLTIISQNLHHHRLIDLLLPFKEVLQKSHSKKVMTKVQEALTHITTGLVSNQFLSPESLFVFLYGVANESIPELVLNAPKREITEEQREKMMRAKPDCFIVPEAPKRSREAIVKRVRTSASANAHMLVEFSLNMLYVLLKRDKISKSDCAAFVDPLVPLLLDSLRSDHVRVTTVALKCLSALWTMRLTTPQLTEAVKDATACLFSILHKYATFGMSKQDDNFFLVKNAFKAVTVLIRNVKYHKLDTDQLKTLLLYAEQDCDSDDKQAHSFALLKCIVEAKLVSPELHEVMEKVAKIAILSESARSREESRTIFASYVTNYSLGKKIERHMQFFVTQLNYEMQHGRESALTFLQMIIAKWPVSNLSKHAGFLFLSLGACMLNDAAAECRALAASAIEALLRRLPAQDRAQLYQLILTFFNDNKPVHYELAAQLCSRFVLVEHADFKSRLGSILPVVSGRLSLLSSDATEGRFVRPTLEQQEDKSEEDSQKERDHSLIQILNLMEKITQHCPSSLTNRKFYSEMDDIAQQCQVLLAYPHAWVRLKATRVLSDVIESVNAEELSSVVRGAAESERGFLFHDTENTLRSLVLDLCAQYTVGVTKEMAELVTGALFRIFKLVDAIPEFNAKSSDTEVEDGKNCRVDVGWILFRLRKATNIEVARAPMATNIRASVLSMLTHVVGVLARDKLEAAAPGLAATLARALGGGDAALAPLRQLAGRVGKKLRRRLGDVEYGRLLAAAQNQLNVRRAERKKLILQEKVNNPEKAAKRKLHLKEKKKESKKIKIEMMQGRRARPRKRKAEDIEIEDEF